MYCFYFLLEGGIIKISKNVGYRISFVFYYLVFNVDMGIYENYLFSFVSFSTDCFLMAAGCPRVLYRVYSLQSPCGHSNYKVRVFSHVSPYSTEIGIIARKIEQLRLLNG